MIDLHTHTIYSDGSFNVEQLLSAAQKLGLNFISVTDHNTLNAYADIMNPDIRNKFKGNIIPGVEFTTVYNGEIIELLCYGFDIEKIKEFISLNCYGFEEKMLKEYNMLFERYKEIGIVLDEKDVADDPTFKRSRGGVYKLIVKHPENYKYFYNKNSINNPAMFTRYEVYNPQSPLYFDESPLFPSLDKIVSAVHNAGGKVFLAHLFEYVNTNRDCLANLVSEHNIDGLECYHTIFTDEQTDFMVKYCKYNNLFMSGGSDFHGENKINVALAKGHGNLNIDDAVVSAWISDHKML